MIEAHIQPKPPRTPGDKYTENSLIECPALGVFAFSSNPTLTLCRKLTEMGHGDQPMTVFRNGIPAMHVRSIHGAARLTVRETDRGPRFTHYRTPDINASGAGVGAGEASAFAG